jgi:hypothetical protein
MYSKFFETVVVWLFYRRRSRSLGCCVMAALDCSWRIGTNPHRTELSLHGLFPVVLLLSHNDGKDVVVSDRVRQDWKH